MHILIDKAKMKVLAKHHSVTVLANLAWIEMHDRFVAILPIDQAKTFAQFTELELRTLYANSTGCEFPGNKYPALLQVVCDICRRMDELAYDADELEAQAASIKPDTPYRYRFVANSNRPARESSLFEPEAITAPRDKNAELMAMKNGAEVVEEELFTSTIIETGKSESVNLDEPKLKKAKPTKKKATAKKPTKTVTASKGSKKELIWGIANKHWEAAGSPTNKEGLKSVKKATVSELVEQHGINKNTANGNVSRWEKEIIN